VPVPSACALRGVRATRRLGAGPGLDDSSQVFEMAFVIVDVDLIVDPEC
jgi:hypothetical protein